MQMLLRFCHLHVQISRIILKSNKTNRIIQIVPCKTAFKSLKKDHTKFEVSSDLIKKMFKAVLIQISFVGIIQVFFYIKPTLIRHVLQSLQGYFLGFHFLILFLKAPKLGNSF